MDNTVAVGDAAQTVDRALSEIERFVGFLLHVTPVNAAEAWEDFERGGYSTEPTLRSRPLKFDPDTLRLRLYELPVAGIEDLAIGELLNTKRDELARQITLLADRDTSRFIYGST